MNNRIQILDEYKIFGSKLRGEKEIENRVKELLHEKESPENLASLSKALVVEWRYADENVSNLTLAFSKFKEKLEVKMKEGNGFISKDVSNESNTPDMEHFLAARIE